jgi:circadian clock protein KaiC
MPADPERLEKAETGVPGFDAVTGGGLPRARTTLVVGGPGAGKSLFALQCLVGGARRGEPGVFVAFEESSRQIKANAASFGWDLPQLEKNKLLFFFDASLSPEVVTAGDFDLAGMLAMLKRKTDQLGAKRIVFDGIDVLLGMLDNPSAERREIHRVRAWLDQVGLTGIITGKVDDANLTHYSFMQFMVDCVIAIRHDTVEGNLHRHLRVVKYRGSSFVAQDCPMSITPGGIEVLGDDQNDMACKISSEKISLGVPELDTMLSGGIYRGSSVLISGAPGTAKSTLAGAFADAACRRGEKTLYVSFDEPADQIQRNLKSVGIDLARHVASNVLRMYSARTQSVRAIDHLIRLKKEIRDHQVQNLVIDPISAVRQAGDLAVILNMALLILDYAKMAGITVVATSLVEGSDASVESTTSGISTIADTWIHLSYVIQEGERNRALTLVKSRGAGHSNQVRELILGSDGIHLAEVYLSQGQVLMGVARWQKETDEKAQREARMAESELRAVQLQLAYAETEARLAAITKELEARKAELRVHAMTAKSRAETEARNRKHLLEMRGGAKLASAAPRLTKPAKKLRGGRQR